MEISKFPLVVTDWSTVTAIDYPGETGFARWRTQHLGDIRVRMVEYSAGYKADHWCAKGHVMLCLDGEMETELRNGQTVILRAGLSYQVGDGDPPHRTSTKTGCTLFIVD